MKRNGRAWCAWPQPVSGGESHFHYPGRASLQSEHAGKNAQHQWALMRTHLGLLQFAAGGRVRYVPLPPHSCQQSGHPLWLSSPLGPTFPADLFNAAWWAAEASGVDMGAVAGVGGPIIWKSQSRLIWSEGHAGDGQAAVKRVQRRGQEGSPRTNLDAFHLQGQTTFLKMPQTPSVALYLMFPHTCETCTARLPFWPIKWLKSQVGLVDSGQAPCSP